LDELNERIGQITQKKSDDEDLKKTIDKQLEEEKTLLELKRK